MPVEGFPDPEKHLICIRCGKWYEPHEGEVRYPEASSPISGMALAARQFAGDESAKKFVCYSCLRKRKLTKAILFGALVFIIVLVLVLEYFGVV